MEKDCATFSSVTGSAIRFYAQEILHLSAPITVHKLQTCPNHYSMATLLPQTSVLDDPPEKKNGKKSCSWPWHWSTVEAAALTHCLDPEATVWAAQSVKKMLFTGTKLSQTHYKTRALKSQRRNPEFVTTDLKTTSHWEPGLNINILGWSGYCTGMTDFVHLKAFVLCPHLFFISKASPGNRSYAIQWLIKEVVAKMTTTLQDLHTNNSPYIQEIPTLKLPMHTHLVLR